MFSLLLCIGANLNQIIRKASLVYWEYLKGLFKAEGQRRWCLGYYRLKLRIEKVDYKPITSHDVFYLFFQNVLKLADEIGFI